MKKLVISVTNDLATDQRVKRSIDVWQSLGVDITLVGRKLPQSLPLVRNYKIKRFKLWFNKGFLFYANYNIRLFFYLLFNRFDIYYSNDLDTLLPNFLISKLKGKPLIYDSHEYFTGVPEIQYRPVVKKVWQSIERFTLPHVQHFITVNQSIRNLYLKEYGKNALVIRNVSDLKLPENPRNRKELSLPEDKFILINQGTGINIDRGMEEALEALVKLPDVCMLLVGKGDAVPSLKERVKAYGMESQVIFIDPKPYLEMLEYTLNADCGLSLDKSDNLNYKFSLPNKLFDYIKCGIPVVTSDVVEVKSIVEKYKIGEIIKDHSAEAICKAVDAVRSNPLQYKQGLLKAREENNWEIEREGLKMLFNKVLHELD